MQYEQLTCSLELAQRMAELGIFQDEPELWWSAYTHEYEQKKPEFVKWKIRARHQICFAEELGTTFIIAQTLPRMMAELTEGYCVGKDRQDVWHVIKATGTIKKHLSTDGIFEGEVISVSNDGHLPNAVAKALIAIKESK